MTSGDATGRRWTQVLETKDGRGVRADYRCISAAAPERYIFEQELEGSPFARTVRSSLTEIHLMPDEAGTEVVLSRELKLRGLSRLGGFMFRRPTARILADALQGLERATSGGEPTGATS